MTRKELTMSSTDTKPNATTDGDVELDDHDELDDESWPASTNRRGFRVRGPAAALGLGIAVGLGMWGGATLQARQTGTTPSSAAGAGRTAFAGTAAGGAPGAGARGGGLTGTVASVHGNEIQLTTTTGSTVTVTLLPSTTVARTASAAPSDISAGETVTVRGQTGSDGSTTAQAVTIVPATTTGG
jgi:hypothetical protein